MPVSFHHAAAFTVFFSLTVRCQRLVGILPTEANITNSGLKPRPVLCDFADAVLMIRVRVNSVCIHVLGSVQHCSLPPPFWLLAMPADTVEPCDLLLHCAAAAAAPGPIDRPLRAVPADGAGPSRDGDNVEDTSSDSASKRNDDEVSDLGSWLLAPLVALDFGSLCQSPECCVPLSRREGMGFGEDVGRAPRLEPGPRRRRLPRRKYYDNPFTETPPTSGDEGSRSRRYENWSTCHNCWIESAGTWPRPATTWTAPLIDRPPRAAKARNARAHLLICPQLE